MNKEAMCNVMKVTFDCINPVLFDHFNIQTQGDYKILRWKQNLKKLTTSYYFLQFLTTVQAAIRQTLKLQLKLLTQRFHYQGGPFAYNRYNFMTVASTRHSAQVLLSE